MPAKPGGAWRFRPVCPPQRTSYVSLTSATGEEAGVLADGAGAGDGDVEVLVMLLGETELHAGHDQAGGCHLVDFDERCQRKPGGAWRFRSVCPPQRTPYVSPTRTAGDEVGVLADDAVPPADEENVELLGQEESGWVSLRLLERSKSDSRMPDLEAMPIRVSPFGHNVGLLVLQHE